MLKKVFQVKRDISQKSYVKSLDGLRGLAVGMVVLAHMSNSEQSLNLHPLLDFSGLGKTGVYIFFFLSSYLLDRQIILNLKSNKDSVKYWGNYLLRRFLRIYPLFTISLVIYWLIARSGYNYCVCIRSLNVLWSHITLQQANGIFWSIPVEFTYYLVSPLIIMCYKYIFKWNFFLISLSTIAVMLYTSYVSYFNNIKFDHTSLLPYLSVFLLGSLLSYVEIFKQNFLLNLFDRYNFVFNFIGNVSLFLLITIPGTYFYESVYQNISIIDNIFFRRFRLLQAVLILFVLLSAKYGKGLLSRIFENSLLGFIGIVSFSFYLFHMGILKYFRSNILPLGNESLISILYLLITLFISYISFLLIEKPLSKIRLKY